MAVGTRKTIERQDLETWIKRMMTASDARKTRYTAKANAAGVTYTAAEIINALVFRSGAAGVSDTTPTATQIVAALSSPSVGDVFNLSIVNTNSGTLTIVAGAGVTLAGTTTVPTVNTRQYQGRITNVATPAVTLLGTYVAAN